ncbi:MAG TPA: thioesterase family protein [Dongiaceae bacterium]|jgi:acyl-CoA thioester hydrolase|nr:thioesterase family protein [Dongiaceae bacterium]
MTMLYTDDDQMVLPDWIDHNGHMNVSRYLILFDVAIEKAFTDIGIRYDAVAETGITTFAVENHLTYHAEVFESDRLRVTSQLLDYDEKRWHWFQRAYHAEKGYLAASCEWLVLCIDIHRRRAAPMPPALARRTAEIHHLHAALPRPSEAGRNVSLANKRAAV